MEILTPTADEIAAIRVLVPDTDAIYGDDEDQYLFSDPEYGSFYSVARGNIVRAAGYAMIAIGNSEGIISKVIKTQDLQTNGADLQAQFRQAGTMMLNRADKEEANEDMYHGFELIFPKKRRPELTESTFPDYLW